VIALDNDRERRAARVRRLLLFSEDNWFAVVELRGLYALIIAARLVREEGVSAAVESIA